MLKFAFIKLCNIFIIKKIKMEKLLLQHVRFCFVFCIYFLSGSKFDKIKERQILTKNDQKKQTNESLVLSHSLNV